ncbi:MAG TPA: hypothetical protein VGE66_19575 [Chitinophagaceae bacterium]
MKFLHSSLLVGSLLFAFQSFTQKVVYSEPERDESRRMNFEVIGKVSGNFLIYKENRSRNYIGVYDNDMVQVAREEHDYIPNDRLINVDFIAFNDYAYMIYQYQKRNVVYCDAVKLDGQGKKVSDVMPLDTSHISGVVSNRIYSMVNSEDKSKIMVFKVNSRNKSNYIITTMLFDEKLELKKRTRLPMPMEERYDYLDEFTLDNDGDLAFVKFTRNSNDNITKASLVLKPAQGDEFLSNDLALDNIFLDELHIKADNANKRYFLTSFYYKQKRGNIEGFSFYVWDKPSANFLMRNNLVLGEELRREARGESNIKAAFNDYFIRNIIVRRDGGFIISSEAYYTTSRFNNWNRWDYLFGSPYYYSSYDYYAYSPMFNSWYWRTRYNNSQAARHHADNITILSFDNTGKLEWNNVIKKEQFDDQAGDFISYLLMNTGGQLHYIFNREEKSLHIINDFSVSPDGQINRNPTLKNLDRGHEFLPKFGKQVSAKQMIIPCYYRNYICFAKLDFNS